MQILGKLFNIIIFINIIGSLFTVMLLFLQKVMRSTLPIWIGILGAVFYLVPIAVPQIKLVSPEESIMWVEGYAFASMIWLFGAVVFFLYYLMRGLFAYRAIRRYVICKEERIAQIYNNCGKELKHLPTLLFGTLKEPACVITLNRPIIILNRDIILQLSDKELQAVLCHELMHIKRKHHLAQRIYDLLSVLYWFNPLIWIGKHEFSNMCEMDCDNHTIETLTSEMSVKEYMLAMLHLMELSSKMSNIAFGKIGALGFLKAKQRITNILYSPSKKRNFAMLLVMVLCIAFTIVFSATISRKMFYPYPAYSNGEYEYSDIK